MRKSMDDVFPVFVTKKIIFPERSFQFVDLMFFPDFSIE